MPHNLFYDGKHHLKPFGLDGAVKPGEEETKSVTYLITRVFIKQPLASPRCATNENSLPTNYVIQLTCL